MVVTLDPAITASSDVTSQLKVLSCDHMPFTEIWSVRHLEKTSGIKTVVIYTRINWFRFAFTFALCKQTFICVVWVNMSFLYLTKFLKHSRVECG